MDLVAGRLEANLHTIQETDPVHIQGEGLIRLDLYAVPMVMKLMHLSISVGVS
jgi:hypothetical protein